MEFDYELLFYILNFKVYDKVGSVINFIIKVNGIEYCIKLK